MFRVSHSVQRMCGDARGVITAVLVATLCICLPSAVLHSQEPDSRRSVAVVLAGVEPGDPSLAKVNVTLRETLERSFRTAGDIEIRRIPAGAIPADVSAGDSDALAQLSERESLDYVVFGTVSSGTEGRAVIQAGVWDRRANTVPVNEQQTAFSLFETFHVADELARRITSVIGTQGFSAGTAHLTSTETTDGNRAAPGFAFFEPELQPRPPVEPPRGGAEIDTEVTAIGGQPRAVMVRLQSGGGFLGAAGADFSPGSGLLRTGIVAGGTVLARETTPAVAVAAALEPTFGRLVIPVGVSSFLTADPDTVTAAVGVSLGLSVRFSRVIRELFLDNVIYFNAYPNAELPLVYLPALGVRL